MLSYFKKFVLYIKERINEHNRRYDMEYLWPVLKQQANDLDLAKLAFSVHVACDPSWSNLPTEEIEMFIDELE